MKMPFVFQCLHGMFEFEVGFLEEAASCIKYQKKSKQKEKENKIHLAIIF
jgi:hypothetical protein